MTNAPAEHLPAIEAAASLTLKAVYSRSQASAAALAAASKDPASVDVYYDSPAAAGKSLDDLLARADIAAVVVALPILHQPGVVEKALKAGKHVLSEKPVAGDVADGKRLVAWHEALGEARPLWAVAENWRYMESIRYAAQKLGEIGGELVAFRLFKYGFVYPDNKYFKTECEFFFLLVAGCWRGAGSDPVCRAQGSRVSGRGPPRRRRPLRGRSAVPPLCGGP